MVVQVNVPYCSGSALDLRDEDGAAAGPVGVDGARQGHDAIGVGGSEHRAVVGVADGERVRQRVIEAELRPREVAHGRREVRDAVGRQVGLDERVHLPAVPALVLGAPFVRDVVGAVAVLARELLLEVERLEIAGRVHSHTGLVTELVPHRDTRAVDLVHQDLGVREPSHARQRAEVVVERAVLLHEEDDVADVAERRQCGGTDGQCALDRGARRRGERHSRRAGGAEGQAALEQRPPADAADRSTAATRLVARRIRCHATSS